MSKETVQLILALIPLAESLIFEIGGKLVKMNTSTLTKEELLKQLEESRNFPDLQFVSPVKEG